jgi:hypothetical protein
MDHRETYPLTIDGANGTFAVNGLTMNGNNYVSEAQVDTNGWPPMFKLTAKDSAGNTTEEHAHAKLIQQVQYDWDGGKWYLAFAPVSEQEITNAILKAQVEYLAMIADADLEV